MGEVFLSEPAPVGGARVILSSSSSSASVPRNLWVQERETSATFNIKTKQVGSVRTATITATYAGSVSASLTITPAGAALSSVSVNPTTVVGGSASQGTANLTGPAPTGGLTVALACNNTLVAGVPPSVTVPSGSTSATFIVSTNQVLVPTSVTISGSQGGATTGSALNVEPPSSGLAVAYGFNEGSGTSVADASGNANTATLFNGAAWVLGRYGSGVSLDGVNDYLSIPNSTSTNILGSGLTLSMWLKPQTLSSGDSVVIGKFWNPDWSGPRYQYGLELYQGNMPHLFVGTSGGLLGVQMGSQLPMGQWSHLAVVFNGLQAQFYVNGALVSTQPLIAVITARGNPMNFGADAQPAQYYKGQIDEVRIYNRTISASEVQSNMNTPIGGGTPPPPDTTPPAITGVAASSITSGGATISWTTNEAGSSQVEYGTTTAYGSSTTLDSTLLTSHAVALSGLTANTLYHCRVKSSDAAGNLATSGDFTLTTLPTTPPPDTTPPVISGVGTSSITAGGAIISWTTNEASNTQVDYGTTTSYGGSTTLDSTLVTNHSATLSGLSAGTLYHYRVKSRDAAGNLATSGDFTFTTLATDVAPPVISGVGASSITSGGATISWTTNEASNTQVDYGTTTAYGSSTTLVSTLVTSHSTTLSGLSSGTLYHYRVKSRDAAGNLATSGDFTFTTASTDTTPPVISGVSASSITSGVATINWTTNEASDTQVDYGTTTAYGSSTSLVSMLVTSHSATLSGLSASTLYHYRVKSRDGAGILATSGDFTFTTSSTTGASFYVATNGNDSNPGTQTQPFRTLSRGVNFLTPGATLFVRAGTYTASTQLANIPSGTSWSAPVTIKAFPGEQVTLVGESGYQVVYFNNGNHHIVVDGFIIDATGAVNGVKITYNSTGVGSHHVRISNCEVKNATYSGILTAGKPFGVGSNEFINCRVHDNGTRQSYDHGIYLECDNELVDGCEIYNNAAYGVHIWEDDPTNITIRNCRVHGHDGAAGILVGSATGNYVYNNVVYGNSWGISLFYGGGGAVYNNTVYNNFHGIYVCCNAQASTIENNIVYNNSGFGLYVEDTSVGVMTMRNNISARNAGGNFRDNSGRAALSGNFIGDQYDPMFVNAAANDYRLLAGSQAIDTGRVITGLTTDCVGVARPRGSGYDIGAYEF